MAKYLKGTNKSVELFSSYKKACKSIDEDHFIDFEDHFDHVMTFSGKEKLVYIDRGEIVFEIIPKDGDEIRMSDEHACFKTGSEYAIFGVEAYVHTKKKDYIHYSNMKFEDEKEQVKKIINEGGAVIFNHG